MLNLIFPIKELFFTIKLYQLVCPLVFVSTRINKSYYVSLFLIAKSKFPHYISDVNYRDFILRVPLLLFLSEFS
jgi:hypothetical protein